MKRPEKIKFKDNLCMIQEEVNHANSYNDACEDWEIRENVLLRALRRHYNIFGYEKQHYLQEILEEHFEIKFKIDGLKQSKKE